MEWPGLEDAKAWLTIDDTIDDVALQEAVNAATSQQERLLSFGMDEDTLPDNVRLAWLLRVQRYLARRNSPDGLVGFGDFGPARVTRIDADIEDLEGPHRTETTVVA